jgi:excisionase family DNA binding protein
VTRILILFASLLLAASPRRQARPLTGITQAAAYADVCDKTIRRWIADGRLTGYRVGPKLIKVDLNELDRIIRPVPTAGNGAA